MKHHQNPRNRKNPRRKTATILAIVIAAALLLTGTYAWYDFTQEYRNTMLSDSNERYDPILVDEFIDGSRTFENWTVGQELNKQVYVTYEHADECYESYGGHVAGPDCYSYLPTWVRVLFKETMTVTNIGTGEISPENDGTIFTGEENERVEWTLNGAAIKTVSPVDGFDLWDGEETGEFWLLDDSGWFYWAAPLKHGDTTADLMTNVKLIGKNDVESIEYHIDVQMEAIDRNLSDLDKWTTSASVLPGVSEAILDTILGVADTLFINGVAYKTTDYEGLYEIVNNNGTSKSPREFIFDPDGSIAANQTLNSNVIDVDPLFGEGLETEYPGGLPSDLEIAVFNGTAAVVDDQGNIMLDAANFPDANLLALLTQPGGYVTGFADSAGMFLTNHMTVEPFAGSTYPDRLTPAEINAVEEIYLVANPETSCDPKIALVSTLKGVELFPNLKVLQVGWNQVSVVAPEKISSLKSLVLQALNQFNDVDVSGNP